MTTRDTTEVSPTRFPGRRALVTGATQGIGRATVHRLTAAGVQVVALARDRTRLNQLQSEAGCEVLLCDLSDPEAAAIAARSALPLDMLVNCAGQVIVEPFLETSAANFDQTLRVNTLAPMHLAQTLARDWIARRHAGSVVNVSSIASRVGTPGHAAYCASKAALDALTRVMAVELGHHGIRVNSVNPVVTRTPMAAHAWADPDKAAAMQARIPLGRFAESDEVAAAIVFLLSRDAAMIHGTCIDVDGGFRAG